MTDEEREKLCKRLRSTWSTVQEQVKAAEEIKRLASRVKSLETVAELNLQEGERLAAENDEMQSVAWRKVLEPFAKAADFLEKCRDDRPLWSALDTGWAQREQIPLTVGDLRRARDALAQPDAEPQDSDDVTRKNVEDLCEEAAAEIERLTEENKRLRDGFQAVETANLKQQDRQGPCAKLLDGGYRLTWDDRCEAAKEIERLAADNERLSDHAEHLRNDVLRLAKLAKARDIKLAEAETALPCPDASAGLIEAAEIAEEWDSGWGEDRNTRVARQTAVEIAEALRARAADRSTK